jgi:hypothetical protein
MSATPARGASAPVESYAVSRLAESGELVAAAAAARSLLEAGHDALRLRTYVWLGSFADEGFAALPEAFLEAARHVAAPAFTADAPARVSERALTWMFRTLGTKLAFHRASADVTWRRWLATPADTLEQTLAALSELHAALEAAAAGTTCLGVVAGFERVLRDEIAPRLAQDEPCRGEPRAPEPSRAPAADDGADDEEEAATATAEEAAAEHELAPEESAAVADFDVPDLSEARLEERHAGDLVPPSEHGSPLLLELAHRLAAFAELTATQRFEKAGVLARTLESEIASFDPGRYFPELFAPYYRALHRHRDELAPYLEPARTAPEHALEQCCRLDFEAFVADE